MGSLSDSMPKGGDFRAVKMLMNAGIAPKKKKATKPARRDLAAFVAALKRQGKRPQTISNYRRAISRLQSRAGLRANEKALRAHVAFLRRTLEAESARGELSALTRFFDWSGRREHAALLRRLRPAGGRGKPAVSPNTAKLRHVVVRLSRRPPALPERRRALALAALCLFAGLRLEEAVALHVRDVAEDRVSVRSGNRRRVVPLSPSARRALAAWAEVRGASKAVFEITSRQARRDLAVIAQQAGMKSVAPLALHRAFAVRLVETGVSQIVIESLVSPRPRKAKPAWEDIARAVKKAE